MGLCSSSTKLNDEHEHQDQEDAKKEYQASQILDQALAQDYALEQETSKILLLGAGESGKSTLMKQMKQLYGQGFTESERQIYRTTIFANVSESMQTLVRATTTLASENSEYASELLAIPLVGVMNAQIGNAIKALWADEGIISTFANPRRSFQLFDSAEYFFNKIDELMVDNYVPSIQDIFRARRTSSGIQSELFDLQEGNKLLVVDVGGQRSERKKWIHQFDSVTAVLFVAALSGYDQTCFEDESTNRLQEDVDVFHQRVLSYFEKTAIIFFLNKKDLYAEKIKKSKIKDYFPQYTGDEYDYEQGVQFIQDLFLKDVQRSDIYIHHTCATDTDHMAVVFLAVQEIIVQERLLLAGLM